MNFNRLRRLPCRSFSRTIELIRGSAAKNQCHKDVQLRGIKLNSNYQDNPNLIFFVDYFDKPQNWLSFFMSNGTLDHRNVYILNSPNFGNSDYTDPNNLEYFNGNNLANIVERFMWENKMSTATLGGHGFGAKHAMVLGCHHSEVVTGIVAIDYTPMDYSKFDVTFRLKTAIQALSEITADMKAGKMTRGKINQYIEKHVEHPKMQALFKQNVLFLGGDKYDWDFNMDAMKNNFSRMVNWKESYGLYPGRANFLFPDYSDYVFLNSHSIAMKKIAVKTGDFMEDIVCEITESDEPYNNHWVYEDADLSKSFGLKLNTFLHMYDGVHPLLMNRRDVYDKTFIPARIHERNDQLRTDIFPTHQHHNWRYLTK
jgi:pimeloyl-ACP methyl ester carboxylesterase